MSCNNIRALLDTAATDVQPTGSLTDVHINYPCCRNVGALLDTIAADVRQQLSNKHSMRAPFDPKSLVKLLTGFARLRHISSSSSGMLDAVAGFVIRRINAGHLNAVTKAADLAQLLQAYAALGHSTVVMPDLLTAVSNQVTACLIHVMPTHVPQAMCGFVLQVAAKADRRPCYSMLLSDA